MLTSRLPSEECGNKTKMVSAKLLHQYLSNRPFIQERSAFAQTPSAAEPCLGGKKQRCTPAFVTATPPIFGDTTTVDSLN